MRVLVNAKAARRKTNGINQKIGQNDNSSLVLKLDIKMAAFIYRNFKGAIRPASWQSPSQLWHLGPSTLGAK